MPTPADAGFTADAANTISLFALRENEFAPWLEKQPAQTRNWLATTRFRPQPGNVAWLPNVDGTAAALAICHADSLYAVADLPLRLPAGDYRLASSPTELLVLGWGLGAYQYTRYKSAARQPARLIMPAGVDAQRIRDQLASVYLVRDLINTPTSDMLPEHLAAAASSLAQEFAATCNITVGDDLLRDNFPTIHAVGRASANAPRLIDLQWGRTTDPSLTLIGKGVCFDSGGLDIKPSNNMRLMKKDMGGAAHVLGIARLVMAQRLPVRLRVLIPAVENAIAGNAFRPGDIIRTRKGLTVEIDNTDAEGRLVLCDAIALACEGDPGVIVDFATLTGAARTALGAELPAMFCNDDAFANALLAAGRDVADPLWRLPLHQPYRKMLDTKVADIVNSAASPYAGAITAALFLEAFVKPGVPWVHFDIMAWNNGTQPGRPEGGEAMGMRAVYAHLAHRFGGQ